MQYFLFILTYFKNISIIPTQIYIFSKLSLIYQYKVYFKHSFQFLDRNMSTTIESTNDIRRINQKHVREKTTAGTQIQSTRGNSQKEKERKRIASI